MPQTNYAQMIVEITDKEASPKLARPIQDALDKEVPGAWITVRQLQTNPVENPVELLISGQADVDARNEASDIRTLRQIARQAEDIVSQAPGISVLRDDWFPDDVQQRIQIDPDRANVVGITNADVANASTAAMSGDDSGRVQGRRQEHSHCGAPSHGGACPACRHQEPVCLLFTDEQPGAFAVDRDRRKFFGNSSHSPA